MKGDREKFLENGMDGYVTKPVDFGTLPKQNHEDEEKKAMVHDYSRSLPSYCPVSPPHVQRKKRGRERTGCGQPPRELSLVRPKPVVPLRSAAACNPVATSGMMPLLT
jgi:CheY-like chemotaxis protein